MSKPASPKKKGRLTWQEKLRRSNGLPKTIVMDARLSKKWGEGVMVIPAPLEVDEIMKTVKRGRLITINEIRARLSAKHGTDAACPITTGIFAWMAAHAATEEQAEGKKKVTPYWRTLKAGGELNVKYPGGVEALRGLLESEGHEVEQKGKRFFVKNFSAALA